MNAFSHIKWESLRSCSNSYRTYCKIMISYCFGACSTCDVTCQRLWLLSEIWQRNHECLDHSHSMNPGRLQISCTKWALYEIMKIIPFTPLAGTEEKKKSLQNAVTPWNITNFLQQQKLSVQQHYYQSLPINSKQEIQTVTDGLYFLFCCH